MASMEITEVHSHGQKVKGNITIALLLSTVHQALSSKFSTHKLSQSSQQAYLQKLEVKGWGPRCWRV